MTPSTGSLRSRGSHLRGPGRAGCGCYADDGVSVRREGNRIAKGTITTWGSCDPAANGFQLTETYVLDQSGEESSQLSTQNGTTTWERSNVYGAGRLLATYDAAGLHFHLSDPLGTRRVQTDSNGVAETECQSLPYGDQFSCFQANNAPQTADDATPLHFTGKERDTESGNDYFGARYYASTMGRFMSPDPSGLTYADPANPQSLNLYSYVLDNPLKFVDPTGMGICYYGSAGEEATDSDTTDWDLTSTGSDDCQGGTYYDVSDTVTVNADGSGSNVETESGLAPSTILDFTTTTTTTNWTAPSYRRSGYESLFCLGDALKSNGLSLTLDAIGLIPEAKGFTKVFENTAGYQIARAVGNNAGYRGVVATQYGIKAVAQGKGGVAMINGALGLGDTSVKGRISTGVTVAGFIPGLGTYAAGVSIGADLSNINDGQSACVASGKYD